MSERAILGKNIKSLRQAKGLTQKELARKVGLTSDTISKIESEKQENIGSKHLISICRELDVSMEELFMADPETKFIKLVFSKQNIRSVERIINEIKSILVKKK